MTFNGNRTLQPPSAWSCLVKCQLYYRKASHEQTHPQTVCPPGTGLPHVTHYWRPRGYGSTPGTVQTQHRKGDASMGLEARLSEHGKRSPGAPQGEKRLPPGPRRGAGAACRAGGRCAVPKRARRGRHVLAQPLLLGRPSAPAMPLPERPSLTPAAPSPRLDPAWAGLSL